MNLRTRCVRPFVLAGGPAWLLFNVANLQSNLLLARLAGRDLHNPVLVLNIALHILLPFGRSEGLGLAWTWTIPSVVPALPMMLAVPLVTLGLARWVARDASFRFGSLWAMLAGAVIVVSLAVIPDGNSMLSPVWGQVDPLTWPEAIGTWAARTLIATPYLVGWVWLGCTWITGALARALMRRAEHQAEVVSEASSRD